MSSCAKVIRQKEGYLELIRMDTAAKDVHRLGFSVIHEGVRGDSDLPSVYIVFVHGLWGHPRKTWETEALPTSASSRPQTVRSSSDPSIGGGKTSIVGQLMRTVSKSPSIHSVATFSTTSGSRALRGSVDSSFQEIDGSSRSKSNKIYWPRDLLPADLPDARILTYGYDADVIGTLKGEAGRANSFTAHGQDLLVKLEREIMGEAPIIFCAHSLGGIVVKNALHRSKTNLKESLKRVHRLTRCIIFLGTPHRGSRMAGWSETCTKIAQLALLDMRKKLISSLKIDSEILETIQSEFVKMLYCGDFYIHSFQEGRPINATIGKVVDDFSSKFDDNPMQTVEVIDASHRDMARFRTENDAGYRQVLGALRYYISNLDKDDEVERRSIASDFSTQHFNMRTFFSLPYSRNPGFVGRENQIQEIEKRFSGPNKTSFVAVYGLGGIGKSQVAIELAYRWKDSFPKTSVLWLHATSLRRFDESLREVMRNLGIPEAPDTNIHRIVEAWLRNESNGRWLMIIDNVDNEEVLFEKAETEPGNLKKLKLLSCIPKVAHGSILFTTRYKRIAQKLADEIIEIRGMSEEEASQLLSVGMKNENFHSKDLKPLLDELDYIPLAISHSAAFMRENCMSISDYLGIYRESEEERVGLLEDTLEGLSFSDNDIPTQVLTTWSMSFDYVKKDATAGVLASEILSIMSFMDRQEIPKSLLTNFRQMVLKSQYAKAFGLLKATSLISESERQTFSMHRLVQLSMRTWLKQQGKDHDYAEQALKLLSERFPDGSFKTWPECSALIVHSETVLGFSTKVTNKEARAQLLANVAAFQSSRGQYAAAEIKLAKVVALKSELLGTNNLETLQAMDKLALVIRHQARYPPAEVLARKVVTAKENLLGAEHEETLKSSHIVATILGDCGKHGLAEEQNRKILEAREKILGPDHPDTLESGSHLALSLWELGRFEEAERLARNVMLTREKILGEEHPDTLAVAGILGYILEIRGKLAEAEELKMHMLQIREYVLGEDHPDTADSLHDMGWILHQEGHYLEAEAYYDRALASKLKLLGPHHPKTLTTMCNLPVFYCDKGDYDAAERASKRIVSTFERVQGPEHPQTLTSLEGLAVIYRHAGKLDAAKEVAERSIAGKDKVLGKDHPWTYPPISHLGYIITLQGQHEEGEKIIRKAVAGLEADLGKDHPQTLRSLLQLSKNLAFRDDVAALKEAEELARRVLDARTRVLGAGHPTTFKTQYHLARVLLIQGRYVEAEQACREALDGMQRTLGSEHPDVSDCDYLYSEIIEAGKGDLSANLALAQGGLVIDLGRES